MRQLDTSSSLLTFLDELEYTEAALLADPETAALAQPLTDELAEWDAIFGKERLARRAVTRAEALVAVRNTTLDVATTRAGARILAEAGGDRRGAFFRRFFPIAPSTFVRKGLRKQCEATLNKLVPELEKVAAPSPLTALGAGLAAAATAALTALDERAKAKGARGSVTSDVDDWKEGVNTLRTTTYAELLKLGAEKGYPKAWASSFFRSESGAEVAEHEPEPAPAPAP